MKSISRPSVLLFLIIFSYKKAFPSYRQIRKQSGLSKSSIRKAIGELIQFHLIEYEPGNRNRANLYKPLPQVSWKLPGISPVDRLTDHGDGFMGEHHVSARRSTRSIPGEPRVVHERGSSSRRTVEEESEQKAEQHKGVARRPSVEDTPTNSHRQGDERERFLKEGPKIKFLAAFRRCLSGTRFFKEGKDFMKVNFEEDGPHLNWVEIKESIESKFRGRNEAFVGNLIDELHDAYIVEFDRWDYRRQCSER